MFISSAFNPYPIPDPNPNAKHALFPNLILTHSGLEKDAEGYMGLAEKWFVFAMVWSVMAAADEMGRIKLDSFLRDVEVSHLHSSSDIIKDD